MTFPFPIIGALQDYVFVNAEAAAVVAAFTVTPSTTRRYMIDTLVGSLKTAGVWAKMDVLWVMAMHDAQAAQINWKNPGSLSLSPVNSPTFTAFFGYAGNGTTSYLTTGYNASTFGGQYTQNSAHIGIWCRTNSLASVVDIGARVTTTTQQSNLVLRNAPNDIAARMNINADAVITGGTVTDSTGHTLGNRPASNVRQIYKNGVSIASDALVSAAPPNLAWFIGACNTGGVATVFSARQNSIAHAGSSLDSTEAAATYTALNAYMTGP